MKTSECSPSILRLEKISKRFPGVLALSDIDFELREGEVHVLFGENGAGKSTLINIVAGAHRPTSGKMYYRGRETYFPNVHSARKLGVHAVFQEFSLVPQLTVAQNLFLGEEKCRYGFLNKNEMNKKAREILAKLDFDLDPDKEVVYLSRAEQQMVEIAKVFNSELSILILDEPTASLTDKETERLFSLVEQAKNKGVGIIYITHRMGEIRKISDRITVLRDGKYIATVDAFNVTDKKLVELMTGRVIDQIFPSIQHHPGKTILEIENLSVDKSAHNVSMVFKEGEIVGLAGLVGSGKSKTMRACFGLEKIKMGKLLLEGRRVGRITPSKMIEKGVMYIPSDRRNEGLVMVRNVRENITLSALSAENLSLFSMFIKRKKENQFAHRLGRRLHLYPLKIERRVEFFSGGNQQKTMLAKVLTRNIKVFVFDEPTVGVDVATRAAIYHFLKELCYQGAAVVLISSDLPEILHLTNRVYVFKRGILRAELKDSEIEEKNVLSKFF